MRLRNLQIDDCDYEDNIKKEIIDSIKELSIVIEDNYQNLSNNEIAIEFNLGSKLGKVKEYLVVYNNPIYRHNPYVFILKNDNNQDILTSHTDMRSFEKLANKEIRRITNKTIATGFKRLPKHLFLSQLKIQEARNIARTYDDFER